MLDHLYVAEQAAWIYRKKYAWIEFDDLLQTGRIGLLTARDKFDPTINDNFRAFCWKYVAGAIIDSVRRSDTRSRNQRVKDARAGIAHRANRPLLERDRANQDSSPTPEQTVIKKEVWKLVDQLKPQYRQVMTLRYAQDLTVREVGKIMHIDPSRVTHIDLLSRKHLSKAYLPVEVHPAVYSSPQPENVGV